MDKNTNGKEIGPWVHTSVCKLLFCIITSSLITLVSENLGEQHHIGELTDHTCFGFRKDPIASL